MNSFPLPRSIAPAPARSIGSLLIACSVLILASLASSQQAEAQVVQLPSFHTFSYRGSVLVPDGGTVSLGGNTSLQSHRLRRGLGRQTWGRMNASQAAVSATIIDHNQLDHQLLGGTPEEFLARERAKERADTFFSPSAKEARLHADQGQQELGQRKSVDATEEGKALVRFARTAYQKGNQSRSFAAYQMAIDRLDGRLRQRAIEEFKRVFGSAAVQAVRIASRTE